MNYYGTKEYKKEIELLDRQVFCKCYTSEPSDVTELEDNYVLKVYSYKEITEEPGYAAVRIKGSVCRLYQKDVLIFEWKCTEEEPILHYIIHHSDGKQYFLFSLDLYGYGVLDLFSGDCLRYIPQKSKSSDLNKFEETFIWVKPHYDAISDLLAVEGCFWAAPYSVIVLDFSEPMKIKSSDEWLDIMEICPDKIEGLPVGDIDFEKWDTDDLIVKAAIWGDNNISTFCAIKKTELKDKCEKGRKKGK